MPERNVILANLGTTRAPTPDAVRRFLDEFLSDPYVVDWPRWIWLPILRGIVLRRRPAQVARLFESIWTPEGSPLDAGTRRIAAALGAALGAGCRVCHAYRYGEPSLAAAVREARRDAAAETVVIPLFPQRTGATTGTMEALVREAAGAAPRTGPPIRVSIPPADSPGYAAALADRCREAFARMGGPPDHLLVSFHGIPVRFDRAEGGGYTRDCEATMSALLSALGWDRSRATLAFQSRFGPEAWLLPSTAGELEALPGRGAARVAVVCPGFVTEGLETLEEIGKRGEESFRHAGGERLELVAAVEDHPDFVRALARLV